jgi:acyl transferase domain-containing protein
VKSIQSEECYIAISGGITVYPNIDPVELYYLSNIVPADMHCRPFDKSNGFFSAEGCGILILKLLKNAISDGDNIYAVVKGMSIGHNGNKGMQQYSSRINELFKNSFFNANIQPNDLDYIEFSAVGNINIDLIEILALKKFFSDYNLSLNYIKKSCGLGSLEGNVGHIESSAGIAKVIKIMLAFKHHLIPKTINFNIANPLFKLEKSPFYIVSHNQPWEKSDNVTRKAAINSFSSTGVLVQIILEEYDKTIRGLVRPSV